MSEEVLAISDQPVSQPSAVSHQPSGKTVGADERGQRLVRTIGFIAAIREEIAPLVRGWKSRVVVSDGYGFRLFEKRDGETGMAVICSGIGAEHGRRATEALIQEVNPSKIISVGYAGALVTSLKVGDIVEPRIVVNSADGSRTDTGSGQGTLVSAIAVADKHEKLRLANTYGAIAVDMEGASAALAAQAHGIEFAALKAISDPLDFAMPPVQKFVSTRGQFRHVAFALHVMVRPWLWKRTIALARNSAKASHALCDAIEEYLKRISGAETQETQGPSTSRSVHYVNGTLRSG